MMNAYNKGIDDSLLFFFLILVLMFCNSCIFGCGCDEIESRNECRRSC